MFQSAQLFVTICVTLSISYSTLAQWNNSQAVAFDQCACVWDNSTKDYPENSKSSGFFTTTVKYQCGYICKDSSQNLHHVIGNHQASYRTEYGNEVVCDGLKYDSHTPPPGITQRLFVYMWDGYTRAFDPRSSQSSNLRDWGHKNCAAGSSSQRQNQFASVFTATGVDELRIQIGMKKTVPDMKAQFYKASSLHEELRKRCDLNELQISFQQGNINESLNGFCHESWADGLYKRLDSFRLQLLSNSSQNMFLENLKQYENTLLCGYTYANTPAQMRVLQEKTLQKYIAQEIDQNVYKRFSCSLALRGLSWSIMSESAKNALTK